MKDYFKIGIKIAALAGLLVLLNLVYKNTFFKSDLKEYSDIIHLVRDIENHAQVVYLGESSNITVRSDDFDKRSISEMITDYYPDIHFGHITKPASHAEVYYTLLENIPKKSPAETIIVTLNLRSFNAQWLYSSLETPLQKSLVLIKNSPPLFNRFMIAFKDYDIKTDKEREEQIFEKWEEDILDFDFDCPYKNVTEWNIEMASTGIKNPDNSKNWELTALASHYIKAYAFKIDTLSNPRIKDFNKIVDLANKRNWNLVFNLMAENIERADELVGNDLIRIMEYNRQLLINYFQNKGVIVVDNFNNIENEQFIDQDWTTEHYAMNGRRLIAGNLADSLKQFYNQQYVEMNYTDSLKYEFFADCERTVVWTKNHTFSDEQSYSGRYSSKIGDGVKYSMGLEYPVALIPDTVFNKVHIECFLYQTTDNNNVRLIIEAGGENIDYHSHGIRIDEVVRNTNTWNSFQYTYYIPEEILEADIIKVYFHNPGSDLFYVDDLYIRFE